MRLVHTAFSLAWVVLAPVALSPTAHAADAWSCRAMGEYELCQRPGEYLGVPAQELAVRCGEEQRECLQGYHYQARDMDDAKAIAGRWSEGLQDLTGRGFRRVEGGLSTALEWTGLPDAHAARSRGDVLTAELALRSTDVVVQYYRSDLPNPFRQHAERRRQAAAQAQARAQAEAAAPPPPPARRSCDVQAAILALGPGLDKAQRIKRRAQTSAILGGMAGDHDTRQEQYIVQTVAEARRLATQTDEFRCYAESRGYRDSEFALRELLREYRNQVR